AYVDWGFARSAGAGLVQAGPAVSAAQAREAVEEIRRLAAESVEPVAATSRLRAPGAAPAPIVVDRPTWIAANADSMSALMDPVFAQIMSARDQTPSALTTAIGSKVTGGEAGLLLGCLAGKGRGQYDLAPAGPARLLPLAPNLARVV